MLTRQQVLEILLQRRTFIEYQSVDGLLISFNGSLSHLDIPEDQFDAIGQASTSNTTIKVWDTTQQRWRVIRWDMLRVIGNEDLQDGL